MAKKLLITDDALIIRQLIKDAVADTDWEVVGEATNGHEAVERFRELRPDVMTCDVVMPQFDGLHALKGVREIDPQARVIMVSAVDQKDTLKQAFKLGAADFVVKPFQRAHLLDTLNKVAAC